jgi:hypothetical protein
MKYGMKVVLSLFLIAVVFASGCTSNSGESTDTVITTQSVDKDSGVVYSTLVLTVPEGALPAGTKITVLSAPATRLDRFVGGSYYFSEMELEKPATVTITYTDDAVEILALYSLDESDLTLAYWDRNSKSGYVPIESTFDRDKKTVTGKISKLYKDGMVLKKKSDLFQNLP